MPHCGVRSIFREIILNRGFFTVMAAQALSSLADNALFIAAIALILELHGPDWMAPMMKWWFAASYVLLAAFVGAFADSFPKGRVMFFTNAIKVSGCLLMFSYAMFGLSEEGQVVLVCAAYALVGIGAAAYSPAKYGIVTEMLHPLQLVKGNSWIEGLTILSIIMGTVVGGVLVSPTVSTWLLSHDWVSKLVDTPAEAAILMIAFVYIAAALCNLMIPSTNVVYPKQNKNPFKLLKTFAGYVRILWQDKLGQISLGVTTLFWGAGATLQLIVIEWGKNHLGYRLDQASILMGITALGTIAGSILAGRIPLPKALKVLPLGIAMGFIVMLMPFVNSSMSINVMGTQLPWVAYLLLILIGLCSGLFVVPMNALLQHRGHVLLSAGHSIAVQNFNEQLNILVMVAVYTLLLWADMSIDVIIWIFGGLVASIMVIMRQWNRSNLNKNPHLLEQIGQEGHGKAL
jgi:MFS transporter, LPLT family, lysophospholipid transporter